MNTAVAQAGIVIPLGSTQHITLTSDQQLALDKFHLFLLDPMETVFLLQGYSGCGKTTLVRTMLERLPGYMKTVRLIIPKQEDYEVVLTATTNKAADNLRYLTGMPTSTIHSYLGLRVQNNYKEDTTTLVATKAERKRGVLLFIDEASYVDAQLLNYIFRLTDPKNCKIVFVGDPAQLTPVKATGTPVWDAGFKGAALTEVVRQVAGNPIVDLSTKFRHTVKSGQFFSFTPDGTSIKYLSRADFNQKIEVEFSRPDWKYRDSKVLGWTNKCVIGYNHAIRHHVKGDPAFAVGDYAICNAFINVNRQSLKTDQLVEITDISHEYRRHDVLGREFTVEGTFTTFMANSFAERNARVKKARTDGEFKIVTEIESSWIDLRAAYAQTINKAQGSTYNEVFIDLDDVRRCSSGEQIARMLYVAVSRAKFRCYFTGDLA